MSATAPISSGRLKSFIERIERLKEEQKAIAADIREVFGEAKGVGYDTKTMRKVIALRELDPADREEQQLLLDAYMFALETVDRVEARVASGESVRSAAATEGMSKSTAARRVSQNRDNAGNGTAASVDVISPPEVADDLAIPPFLRRDRAEAPS